MESITNAVNSVSATVTNAIYGTGNETGGAEPVSGQTGAGTATDPYDKGNDAALNPSTSSHTQPAPTDTATAGSNPSTTSSSTMNPSHSTGGPTTSDTTPAPSTSTTDHATPGHSMTGAATSAPHMTGPGPEGQSRPDAGSRPGDIRPTEANENRPNVNAGGFGTAEPSVSADPASGQKPIAKQQGADKPLDEPSGAQLSEIKKDKAEGEAEQAQARPAAGERQESVVGEERDGVRHPRNDEEREKMAEKGTLPCDPNDHSGEPMKMHGGPEGGEGAAEIGKTDREGEGGETDRKKSVGQEGGQPHGSAKGTGEEWVKTTGFEGDGGDFDATKPGAGKEATRLLEEKGIHRENGDSANDALPGGEAPSAKKPSAMSKLKDKLNLGTGKNLDN